MDTNHSNSSLEKNELDIKNVLDYFYLSKKIFILISLIFAFISAIYSFYLKDPIYHSSITLEIGQHNDTQVMSLSQIQKEMAYYFQGVFVRGSDEYIKLAYSDKSVDNAEEIINSAAELIISKSNEEILLSESKQQIKRKSMESEINFLSDELERINSIDKTIHSSSGIEAVISDYQLMKNMIEFELENSFVNSKDTQIIKSTVSVKENPRHLFQTIIGFFVGLFLTSVFLTLRLAFLK